MNAQLDQAVQDAIAQNLPAATAAHLGEYLKAAALAIKELEIARDRIEVLEKTVDSQSTRIVAQDKAIDQWEKREADLQLREKAVLDHEHRLEIAQLKVEHANDKTALATQLFGTVFRNTVVREEIFKNKEVQTMSPVYGQNGLTGYVPSGIVLQPDPHTTHRTEE